MDVSAVGACSPALASMCMTGLLLAQVGGSLDNPVAAGRQRYEQLLSQLLSMGFERRGAHEALLKASRQGPGKEGDGTLLRAVECLTQT